MIVILAS